MQSMLKSSLAGLVRRSGYSPPLIDKFTHIFCIIYSPQVGMVLGLQSNDALKAP